MPERSKNPNGEAQVFDLSWETDDDAEDAARADEQAHSDEDDFEGHASGFHRPDSR